MSGREDGSELSVGKALSSSLGLTVSHPGYRSMVDVVEKKVAELAAARGAARASAALSFVTVALETDEMAMLAEMFPEFRLVGYGFAKPAHGLFVQARRLSSEWLILQARKLGRSVVCYGTPLIAVLEAGFDQAVLAVDAASPVAVHERHSVSLDAYRLYGSYVEVSKNVGKLLARSSYDGFLRRDKVRFASTVRDLGRADIVCVDGYMNAYNPWQVAMAMICSGAEVAFGFVPYHPSMLLNDEGELPGFGVRYVRTETEVRFKYPDGIAGVTSYSAEAWKAWLVGHSFCIGTSNKAWFQLELLKHRGCAMFYRLVKLPAEPVKADIVHALELPSEQPMYVVTSCRMKAFGLDPDQADSWETSKYLVGQRLVDRVYQFAMQLPREQFTRYAIRKQIAVVNNRVTVEGTSVRVNSPLGEKMVDALVVDLYARAFVDRYVAGTLSDDARRFADEMGGFHSLSSLGKLWFITTVSLFYVWEVAFEPVNWYVRAAADAIRTFMTRGPKLQVPQIDVAPSYLLVGSRVRQSLDVGGGSALSAELSRRAATGSCGFFSEMVKTMAQLQGPSRDVMSTVFRVETHGLFTAGGMQGDTLEEVVKAVRTLNPVDEPPVARRMIEVMQVTRVLSSERKEHFEPVADPVYTLNEIYSSILPGVAEQNLEYDSASLSLDPQDRTLVAPYLKLPRYFGDVPKPKLLYQSRLRALNVPKRQQTLQELLSAMAARNLNAPQVALPQDDHATAKLIWENFLNIACVGDARERLRAFKADPVALEEGAFREWSAQSTPDKLAAVKRELEATSKALGEMDVGDYLVMLKADVKPTLSRKPLDSRTEPQVIVYHEKALSALYSCIFRVLVRRFLNLLKPNYHVNLLKDNKDIEAFVRSIHPFGASGLQYLENDFSKYDKSQGRFVFILEELVFRELGMNEEYLRHWLGGHVECKLRAVAIGLSLHVMYQRKSGDATTSFGNVLLNVLSVSYAYRGSEIVWALFMGDDSCACVRGVAHEDDAVAILAEVFNLGAKTYLTNSPYFASNFILIDSINGCVNLVPDPVKRIERWSMAISGDDPQWHERYVSACDALGVYLNCAKTVLLPKLMADRYSVSVKELGGVADCIATLLVSEENFRKIWLDTPQVSNY